MTVVQILVSAGDDPIIRMSDIGAAPTEATIRKPGVVHLGGDLARLARGVYLVEEREDKVARVGMKQVDVHSICLCELRTVAIPWRARRTGVGKR